MNEDVIDDEVEVPEDELQFDEDEIFPIKEEAQERPLEIPQVTRKESDVSVAIDIDMDELERSLDEAESLQRGSPVGHPAGPGSSEKRPYIRPLEYEESDSESDLSEHATLSIIQEEDEEDLSESVAFPSNFSRSASEGFQSDDDVMDLLDEDHDQGESAAHGVDIRRISQTERPAELSTEYEQSGGLGLGRYLTRSDEELKEGNFHPNSHHRLLDSIELEDSEGGAVENTLSDTEADRGGVRRSSTPLDEQEQGNLDYEGAEQNGATSDQGYVEDVPSTEGQAPPDQGLEGGMAAEEQIRVFLALYDYDPATMSPNPDAEEEELAFNEGDLIKVRNERCLLNSPFSFLSRGNLGKSKHRYPMTEEFVEYSYV